MAGSHSIFNRTIQGYLADSGEIALMCAKVVKDLMGHVRSAGSTLSLTIEQIILLGISSIPLVLGAGAAAGAIMAIQLGYGLERFGGSYYTPAVVGISILRELGPLLTSLLLAGKIGSGITAELASMSVTEQVDAIRAMGASPSSTLVAPRVLACIIVLPALSVFADYVAMFSAMIVAKSQLNIDPHFFYSKLILHITLADLLSGIAKTVFFGFLIGACACWRGLKSSGGTRGVGIATTRVVVMTNILILVSDVFLSKLFIALGFFKRY
jgi:phospholipid/cholesterol/gamma-HCH transport system permease protein